MLTLKGIYEHGVVRLLDPVPAETPEPAEVLVTFDGSPQPQPVDPEALQALEGIIGLLNDLTPEELERYDEAVKRRSPFFGPRTALE